MLPRLPLLVILFDLLTDKIDSLTSSPSCSDIIRVSETYTPADSTLTIGTIPTFSYQDCGLQCRLTTLCRTAVWCQGQCTMYQEYIAFGTRSPNLTCMLMTFSGIAYNEIEPVITLAGNVIYEESQSKYYEQTYLVNSFDECTQLCRLDSHCLTASYQWSTSYCALFAEHVSQGRNYTDFDWTTIILDTCAGRDPRIYPCFIDATQAHMKLCDLLSQTQPIKLDVPDVWTESNGYTGWLTKSSIYWPVEMNDEGALFRASYDMKTIEAIVLGYELEGINGKYLHINVDQRTQVPQFHVSCGSSTSNNMHRIRLTEQKVAAEDLLVSVRIGQRCRWCYFAVDDSNVIYVSMDHSDSIERYTNNSQKIISIYLPSPSGIIIRNDQLWIVNASQLIILAQQSLADQTLVFLIQNQIELASLYDSPITDSRLDLDYSSFMPFHLDVDNYGRLYISGALVDLRSGNSRHSPGNNPQLYILTDGGQGIPETSCAGPWGMFGVHVYHSKLKLHMMTSTSDSSFQLFSTP